MVYIRAIAVPQIRTWRFDLQGRRHLLPVLGCLVRAKQRLGRLDYRSVALIWPGDRALSVHLVNADAVGPNRNGCI
jgi:hypothetical protein